MGCSGTKIKEINRGSLNSIKITEPGHDSYVYNRSFSEFGLILQKKEFNEAFEYLMKNYSKEQKESFINLLKAEKDSNLNLNDVEAFLDYKFIEATKGKNNIFEEYNLNEITKYLADDLIFLTGEEREDLFNYVDSLKEFDTKITNLMINKANIELIANYFNFEKKTKADIINFDLDSNEIDKYVYIMKRQPKLISLILNVRLGDGLKEIVKSLSCLETLNSLFLVQRSKNSENELNQEISKDLLEFIKLDKLSCLFIVNFNLNKESLSALCQIIPTLKNLKMFYIDLKQSSEYNILIETIEKNNSLNVCLIGGIEIEDEEENHSIIQKVKSECKNMKLFSLIPSISFKN